MMTKVTGYSARGVVSLPTEIAATLLTMLSDEANHRDRQAREALFLTFSSDLGFFESQVLGTTRSTGAAVTVITDAKVYEPDPRAIRAAGVRYGVGLASTPSVFHPKLTVIAGPDRAAVGIGSGNLTISGWHLNDEVLTVVTGNKETGCPPILTQVADWLEDLATSNSVRIGQTAKAGIGRTAHELRLLCKSAPTTTDEVRLLGNLKQSIISQLPQSPVDELRLFAPFHDLTGQALDELITTLQPSTVKIAVQDRATVIDPHALLDVAASRGIHLTFERVRDSSDNSYRHGKLIEARRGEQLTWTLSGSPNLSPQALGRTVRAGGNCELAVLDHPGRELYPPITAGIPVSELKAVRNGPPSAEEEPVQRLARDGLLEAAINGDLIILAFAHPTSARFSVEVSDYQTDPDRFTLVGDLAAGSEEYSVPADPTWYYPLRLRIVLNGRAGPIHFVMRPEQVVVRVRGGGGPRVPDCDPEQIFADHRQAQEWLSAVTELALHSQTSGRGPRIAVASGHARSEGGRTTLSWDDPATWHAYVDEATQRLGGAMVGFALGGDHSPLLAAGRCMHAAHGDWAVFTVSGLSRRAFAARAGSTMVTAELVQREGAGSSIDHVRFRSFRLGPFLSPTRVAAREGVVLDGDIRAIETPPLDSPGASGAQVLSALSVEAARVRRFLKQG